MKLHSMVVILIAASGWALHGCSMPTNSVATTSPCVGGPTENMGGFHVKVQDVRWANSVEHPSTEYMSQQNPAASGGLPRQKPQATFLVVNLELTNTTNAPIAWSLHGRYLRNYKVVNAQGTQYQFRPDASSMLYKTGGGMGNLNPGMPVSGKVVFDVPKSDYTFLILQQKNTGFGRYVESPVFGCSITA